MPIGANIPLAIPLTGQAKQQRLPKVTHNILTLNLFGKIYHEFGAYPARERHQEFNLITQPY
jgi:hypothetical protein